MRSTPAWIAFAALALCACAANTFQVVEPPLRDASLYPLAQTQGDVTVAVDEIDSGQRAASYFGADLPKAGVLPVNITVTNDGGDAFDVGPSQILLRMRTHVIDPLRTQAVAAVVEDAAGGFSDAIRKRMRGYLAGISFNRTVVGPHRSYQGLLFFPLPRSDADEDAFSIYSLFDQGLLQMDVIVTDRDTNETLRFGPFMLRGLPEDTSNEGWWW